MSNEQIIIRNKYLPYDIKSIIDTVQNFNSKEFNFSFIFSHPDIIKLRGEIKIRINEHIDKYRWDKIFLSSISNRQKKDIENLENSGYKVNSLIEMTLQWRMVIGLGAVHPQETSMTLHHIYGIPYIPGSAIKGLTRHYCILNIFDSLNIEDLNQIKCLEKILENADLTNKDESKRDDKLGIDKFKKKFKCEEEKLFNFLKKEQEKIIEFQRIFGTQKKKGEVIFFDAYPVGDIKLKLDVMTPHYGPYYSDSNYKTPPADYHNPNPIKFLTVEKTKFRFYLASKNKDLLEKAEDWLKDALRNYGIGAKTSIGYGYFEIIE